MNQEKKEEKCPYCGSQEFVEGIQAGYASISPNKVLTFKSATLYHLICLNCGAVVKSYVENPKKLLVNNK